MTMDPMPMSPAMDTTAIKVGNRRLNVALARTPEQWANGLFGYRLDTDGLLMVMPRATLARFHMHKIAEPVLLALFDTDGHLIHATLLEAETGQYTAAVPFAWALELIGPWATPQGILDLLPDLHEGLQ